MIFTREPLVETIITAREGASLIVKNTKQDGEEYSVDAVEVVSLGQCFFFRSLEKPKAFLVPVSDYTVVEVKQTKVVLKSTLLEKSVRISPTKEVERAFSSSEEAGDLEKNPEKKKERRRHRKNRSVEEESISGTEGEKALAALSETSEPKDSNGNVNMEETLHDSKRCSVVSVQDSEKESVQEKSSDQNKKEGKKTAVLLPPPDGLIADTLRKAKPVESLVEEADSVSQKEGSTLFHPLDLDEASDNMEEEVPNHLRSDSSDFTEEGDSRDQSVTQEKEGSRFIFPFQGDVF